MLKELEVATNGQLKVTFFFRGETPFSHADLLKAIRDRNADMVSCSAPFITGVEPLLGVLDLPMLNATGDYDLEMKIGTQLRQGFWKNVLDKWNAKELISTTWPAQQLWTTEDVGFLENWDSLRGYSLRTSGPDQGNLITLLNGTPVTLGFGEVYTSLSTGLIQGLVTSTSAAYTNSVTEIAPYGTLFWPAFAFHFALVNKAAWAELPDDLKAIVTDYFESKRAWYEPGDYQFDATNLKKAILNHNIKVQNISPEFREEIRAQAYEAIWKPWIDRSGAEGAEAFNEVAKLIIAEGYTVPGYTPY